MWASIASAAASIAGSLINSRNSKQSYEEQRNAILSDKAENAAWYNRRYYENPTQRGDVSRVLTKAWDQLRRNNNRVIGTNAVMGGTNATAAAEKEANNLAYADMVSSAAADAATRRDAIEDNYMENKRNLDQQQRNLDMQARLEKAASVANAVQSVGQVASSIEQGNAANSVTPNAAGGGAGAPADAATRATALPAATSITQPAKQALDTTIANKANATYGSNSVAAPKVLTPQQQINQSIYNKSVVKTPQQTMKDWWKGAKINTLK